MQIRIIIKLILLKDWLVKFLIWILILDLAWVIFFIKEIWSLKFNISVECAWLLLVLVADNNQMNKTVIQCIQLLTLITDLLRNINFPLLILMSMYAYCIHESFGLTNHHWLAACAVYVCLHFYSEQQPVDQLLILSLSRSAFASYTV